jgi:hypothetical protein
MAQAASNYDAKNDAVDEDNDLDKVEDPDLGNTILIQKRFNKNLNMYRVQSVLLTRAKGSPPNKVAMIHVPTLKSS